MYFTVIKTDHLFCTGWTGKLCDVPFDECSSNPCQNGAVCIDLHASYSCACLFGKYTSESRSYKLL